MFLNLGVGPTDDHRDAGTPGGSARREFESRQRARQDRVRAKHPKLSGLILALNDDPQSTRAWDVGAVGEERLGGRLTELAGGAFRTRGVEVMWPKKLYPKLHEPGSIECANIDDLHRRLATALPPA